MIATSPVICYPTAMRRLTHGLWLIILIIIAMRPWVLDLILPERLLYIHWVGIGTTLAWWLMRKGWRQAPPKALLIPCIFLFLGYLQSVASSAEPIEGLLQGSALILGIFLFIGVSQANAARRKQLLVILAASGTALALKGLWQVLVIFPAFAHFPWDQLTSSPYLADFAEQVIARRRVFGPFPLPGLFAGALLLTLPITISLLKPWATTTKRRIIGLIILAVQGSAFLLTQSLGGFLSLGCATLIVMSLRRVSVKQRLALLGVIVAVVAVLLSVRPELTDLSHPRNPITQRWQYWQSTVEMIRERPLRGIGASNYASVYPSYQKPQATQTRFAHNVWLQVWAEWGLLGFIGIVGLFIATFRRLSTQSAGVAIAILGYWHLASIDITWSIFQVSCLWWPLFGLLTPVPEDEAPPGKVSGAF